MDILHLLQSAGVAVTCLFGLSWALWTAVRWTADHVVQPVIAEHLRFLHALEVRLDEQTAVLREISQTQQQQQEQLRDLADWLERVRSES